MLPDIPETELDLGMNANNQQTEQKREIIKTSKGMKNIIALCHNIISV
jgi:hypothetical protein